MSLTPAAYLDWKRRNGLTVVAAAAATTGAFTRTIAGVPGMRFNVLTKDQTGDTGTGELSEVTMPLERLPLQVLQGIRDKGGDYVIVPRSRPSPRPLRASSPGT